MYEATYGDLPPREIAHILVMSSSIPEEVSCKENGAGLRFHPQVCFFFLKIWLNFFLKLLRKDWIWKFGCKESPFICDSCFEKTTSLFS